MDPHIRITFINLFNVNFFTLLLLFLALSESKISPRGIGWKFAISREKNACHWYVTYFHKYAHCIFNYLSRLINFWDVKNSFYLLHSVFLFLFFLSYLLLFLSFLFAIFRNLSSLFSFFIYLPYFNWNACIFTLLPP